MAAAAPAPIDISSEVRIPQEFVILPTPYVVPDIYRLYPPRREVGAITCFVEAFHPFVPPGCPQLYGTVRVIIHNGIVTRNGNAIEAIINATTPAGGINPEINGERIEYNDAVRDNPDYYPCVIASQTPSSGRCGPDSIQNIYFFAKHLRNDFVACEPIPRGGYGRLAIDELIERMRNRCIRLRRPSRVNIEPTLRRTLRRTPSVPSGIGQQLGFVGDPSTNVYPTSIDQLIHFATSVNNKLRECGRPNIPLINQGTTGNFTDLFRRNYKHTLGFIFVVSNNNLDGRSIRGAHFVSFTFCKNRILFMDNENGIALYIPIEHNTQFILSLMYMTNFSVIYKLNPVQRTDPSYNTRCTLTIQSQKGQNTWEVSYVFPFNRRDNLREDIYQPLGVLGVNSSLCVYYDQQDKKQLLRQLFANYSGFVNIIDNTQSYYYRPILMYGEDIRDVAVRELNAAARNPAFTPQRILDDTLAAINRVLGVRQGAYARILGDLRTQGQRIVDRPDIPIIPHCNTAFIDAFIAAPGFPAGIPAAAAPEGHLATKTRFRSIYNRSVMMSAGEAAPQVELLNAESLTRYNAAVAAAAALERRQHEEREAAAALERRQHEEREAAAALERRQREEREAEAARQAAARQAIIDNATEHNQQAQRLAGALESLRVPNDKVIETTQSVILHLQRILEHGEELGSLVEDLNRTIQTLQRHVDRLVPAVPVSAARSAADPRTQAIADATKVLNKLSADHLTALSEANFDVVDELEVRKEYASGIVEHLKSGSRDRIQAAIRLLGSPPTGGDRNFANIADRIRGLRQGGGSRTHKHKRLTRKKTLKNIHK
jgi:hypothetical protein